MTRAGLSTFNPRGPAARGEDGTPLERFEALMGSPAYSLLVVRAASPRRRLPPSLCASQGVLATPASPLVPDERSG